MTRARVGGRSKRGAHLTRGTGLALRGGMNRRDALLLFSAGLFSPTAALAGKRPAHVLRVKKAARQMTLEIDGRLDQTFRIGLGGAPEGDKERQGDLRTPEGELYIAWKNRGSSFHRFLGLSYPMPRHAERGEALGLVKPAVVEQVRAAAKRRKQPPQMTSLGGWVGIHGGGSGSDWTLGCIAVSDPEIEWLFEVMQVGDRVVVDP